MYIHKVDMIYYVNKVKSENRSIIKGILIYLTKVLNNTTRSLFDVVVHQLFGSDEIRILA